VHLMTFEELITEIEIAIENAHRMGGPDKAKSYLAQVIFDRLEGVQNAIDDWRQGG
jgi:hypothetical protein